MEHIWNYDLDKANALLDEAGWVMNDSTGIREKDGQKLSLNYTYWTDLSLAQEMALAIKTQLAKVGIDVTTTGQDQITSLVVHCRFQRTAAHWRKYIRQSLKNYIQPNP